MIHWASIWASLFPNTSVPQGGSGNGILSMDFDFASQPGKPDMLLGMDVNEDAIVMCNHEGQIMMVSQVRGDGYREGCVTWVSDEVFRLSACPGYIQCTALTGV